MKKIYILLFICVSVLAQAQISIPNQGFELWNSANYEIPQNYVQSSNPECFFKINAPFNCEKTTDAYHGTYALKLTTVVGTTNDTSMGYVTNGNPQNGNPCTWVGGTVYNQKPTGFRGYYKSNIVTGDSAGIILVFRDALGNCLGTYMYKFGGVHPAYTLFSFPFTTPLPSNPDTVLIAMISSDIFNGVQKAGSMIQLDSLSFTGGVSQPALFNGDFETWQNQTIKYPTDWYMDSNDRGEGISQTADAYSGNYAVELKTILGDNNGNPVARGAGVSTGYNQCPKGPGPCVYKGGHSYTNTKDTLAFYYKYVPSGNDSAQVNITFKKNGSMVFSTGRSIHTAGVYTYMELPFNFGTTPDTAIVEFRSSSWNDTLLAFVGSDLKIDDVRFKSQPITTGITKYENTKSNVVYPNPSEDGIFQISGINSKDIISVYNILGEVVDIMIRKDRDIATVKLSSDTKGIYFMQIHSEGRVVTEKIIVK